jgi:hypothetical protein
MEVLGLDGSSVRQTTAVDEAGAPGLYASFWHGLWAPKGTAKEIIAQLDAAVVGALGDGNVRARLADLGQEIFSRANDREELLHARYSFGLIDSAHFRCNNVPAIREAHPGLHLATHLAGQVSAISQRRGDSEIMAIGRDHGSG